VQIGILSTCELYDWAGTEEVWLHFARNALRQGHQVVLGAHQRVANSTHVRELVGEGLTVAPRRPFRPVRAYLAKQRFLPEMQALTKCDIVLINAGSLFDLINLPWLYQASQNIRCPKIYFCHFCAESLPPPRNNQSLDALLEQMKAWVFVSQHNLNLAKRQLASDLPNSSVVMNGPRLMLEDPLPSPETGEVQMASVARLETRWKGHDVLLEVLAQEQWKSRSWRLNIYGDGPDRQYIENLIAHYHLQDKVTLRGYVRDMTDLWRQNHIKLLPSHGEGTPLAVLEAMMAGRPIVTTDVGGNREILDESTGFIADAATPRCFSTVMEEAWLARDRWAEMGRAAHQQAKKLALQNPAQNLLDVVKAVA